MINADLAKFILDYGDALAVIFGENAIEQGCLARSQKAGEDGYRDAVVGLGGCHGYLSFYCLGRGITRIFADLSA